MKANKILIIIQISLMYISQILLLLSGIILVELASDLQDLMAALFIAGIVLSLVSTAVSIAILVLSVISIFKKNNENMTLFTMIIKLVAIPWYIGNFVLCGFLIAGMLNPFLLLAIPLMICLFVCVTYIDMLAVSANNIAIIISELKKKAAKPSFLLIFGMILQTVFCIDIVGAILTYIDHKKNIITE